MDDTLRELILYACPKGELAMQLSTYYELARDDCGQNAAHRYPPHITLTGFYHDTPASVSIYTCALREAMTLAQKKARCVIRIERMLFEPNFHGLVIDSPWLKHMTASFISMAQSKTRADTLRLKDWLHLSLAYEFDAGQAAHLKHLAIQWVDLSAPVEWDVRLYERYGKDQWRIHAGWPAQP